MQKEKNLRIPPQRKVILEELQKVDIDPSADEIYGVTVFQIIGHNFEFTGICPECSDKAPFDYAG